MGTPTLPVRHLPIAPEPTREPSLTLLPPDASLSAEGEKLLQVGDIARATGKTVRAIHHYEELGLLKPHARSKGRFRLYDASAVTRLRWIGKLHDLGLSLAEIQHMVAAWETSPSAPDAMGRMHEVYSQRLAETRAQIAHLVTLEQELVASLAYLETCNTSCDPIELVAACANCNHHDQREPEPELVAGIHPRSAKTAGAQCSSSAHPSNLAERGPRTTTIGLQE